MHNKNLTFSLVAIALAIAFVGGVLALQTQSEMQTELDNLVSDLNNSGYEWLVDYDVSSGVGGQCTYVSSIDGINEDGKYKTYLDGLGSLTSKVFDLKVFGGIFFDLIIDPFSVNSSTGDLVNITQESNFTHLNLSDGSLVGYWSFDVEENIANNLTYDYSNNSNDGTLNGGVTFNSSGGYYGGAYEFDGTGDISIDSGFSSLSGNQTSLSAWIKINSYDSHGVILLGTNTGNGVWYQISTDSIVFIMGNHFLNLPMSINFDDGIWRQVVFTSNTTHASFYVNGVYQGSITSFESFSTGAKNFEIGSWISGDTWDLDGSLDEVMIFNRSLSQTEIEQIYNSTYKRFMNPGTMNFTGLNFGTNNTVNISIPNSQQLNGSNLSFSFNGGDFVSLNSLGMFDSYTIPEGDLTDSFLTIQLGTGSETFYSPLVVGNITMDDWEVSSGSSDSAAPNVTINSPLNNSAFADSFNFDADISDSGGDTYAFVNDSGLVGYWTFDSTNSTGVKDTSGENNFGSFNGGLSEGDLSVGSFGDALSFDGVGDYVDLGDDDSLNFGTGNFSIVSWVNNNDVSGTEMVFSKKPVGVTAGYGLRVGDDDITFVIGDGTLNQAYVASTIPLTVGTWYLVAFSYDSDSDEVTIYRNTDSQTISVSNFGNTSTSEHAYIGSRNGGLYFNGSLDEVMIFNRSLSQDEISALYNASAQKFNATYDLLSSDSYNNFDLVAVDEAGNINLTSLSIYEDSTVPSLSRESPTPANGSTVTEDFAYLNASVNDVSDSSAWFDWENSLVGYWSFDSTNSTGVYDNSSQSNFGSFNGGLSESDLSVGKRGQALEFDGEGQYVNLGSGEIFNIPENISVSAWIYRSGPDFGNIGNIIGKRQVGYRLDTYDLVFDSRGNLEWVIDTDEGTVFNDVEGIGFGTWYHVVGTYDGSDIKTYINGVLNDTDAGPGGTMDGGAIADLIIGGVKYNPSYVFNGSIDEVMIFNRSLSQEEVQALYNSSAYNPKNNFTSLSDGTYNYKTYAIDEAGNLNITDTRSFTVSLDSIPPTFTTIPADESVNYADDWSGVQFVGTDETSFDSYGIVNDNVNFTINSSGYLDNATDISAGSYSLNISITDANGNYNYTTYGLIVNQISLTASLTNSTNLFVDYPTEFTVGSSESNVGDNDVTYEIFRDGTSVSTGETVTLSAGTYTYILNTTGGQNYSSSSSLDSFDFDVNDTITPNITILYPTNTTYSSVLTTLNFSTEEDTSLGYCWYSTDGGSTNSSLNDCTSNFTGLSSAEGLNNWFIFVNDSQGNENVSSISFTQDTTALNIDYSNGTASDNSYLQNTFVYVNVSVSGEDEDATTFYFYNSSLNLLNLTSYRDSSREINYTDLGDGTYYYNVSVNDSLNNVNTTDTRTITLDHVSPNVSVVLPVAGNIYTSSSVTFQTTTTENSTCNYSLNSGSTNNSMTPNSAGTLHSATQLSLSNAAYTVNYYCSDLAGNLNNSESSTFSVSVSSGDDSGDSGNTGGGGGGGSIQPAQTESSFELSTQNIDRSLAVNRIELGSFNIENTDEKTKSYSIKVETINSIVEVLDSSFALEPGESKDVQFRVTPPSEPGIFTGKIIIKSGASIKEISLTINVKSEKSLFDIILTIPRSKKQLSVGENLNAQVDLLEMGLKEKKDVTLNYVIKDFEGVVHVVESETIAVTDQKTLQKEFHTSELPPGEYILGTELIYPDGVAVASSQFKVGEKFDLEFERTLIFILGAVVIVILTFIILMINRYRRTLKRFKKRNKK